ncbi:branched chain amino acid aminotransferase [Paenibacillus sp. BIHB 4019]|uniref:Branched-chain-amino-acid aminotransferase n=1 Tax=Paenibacillus sp. BIHB 4019 TaxID=1870819 RepID=A0A1B2DMM2_9BACL|nr:branched-chain amino acid aminotransferase [Paenibacillus sp. BIHB 4019]ANY68958.1 branched chain amino acid aminotransferase [Paenibacillus sp. BIHB 4019]
MNQPIAIELAATKKTKPQANQLGFGKYYTDHMFIMDYEASKGWHSPRIVPYQPITLDPASKVFHYGQTVFEGLKAYRTESGSILLFRPEENFKRLNRSNERLSIPHLDEEIALEALKQLITVDQDWIPDEDKTSLYVRPFIIANESSLGVAPSQNYMFMIILSPVGSYYAEGIHPVKIFVESEYVRAVKGGVGNAKTAGNYAAGLKAQEEASAKGCTQVLWLDGVERKYIEEVGSMNVFFSINGTIVTPALNGSILDGITRKSIIELLKSWNIPVEERKLSIDELVEAYHNDTLEEAFGTGTAAVISPIGELHYLDEQLLLRGGETGPLSRKLYETLTGIQTGVIADPFGWTVELPSAQYTAGTK